MARAALLLRLVATTPSRPSLTWRTATVSSVIMETATARSIFFEVSQWTPHTAGQHIDVRLTAPDGYQATRSFSLSSGPDETPQITVEYVEDGEVSPFLVDIVDVGDTLEIRGPVGGYFVWEPQPTPLLLIGGGSGIAPLRSMWRANTPAESATILYSARTRDRVIYHDELAALDPRMVKIYLTREDNDGYQIGRIDTTALKAALTISPAPPHTYVCGPTAFVEAVTQALTPIHADRAMIRTERFG